VQKVKAAFLISGWTRDTPARHVMRIVDGGALDDAKSKLSVITAMHVYSIQPASPKDAQDLIVAEFSQADDLFKKHLLGGNGDFVLGGPALSAVRSIHPPQEPPKRGLTGVAEKNSSIHPAPKAVTIPPGEPRVSQRAGTADPGKVPEPTKTNAGASKTAASSPTRKSEDIATSSKRLKTADNGRTMPKSGKSRAKRTIEDSDDSSDGEDFVAPPAKKMTSARPVAAAKNNKMQDNTSTDGALKPAKGAECKQTDDNNKPATKNLTMAAMKPGIVKVRADVPEEKRTKRVMKTYYNDAGEEVTELIAVTDDETEATMPAPAPPVPAAPATNAPAAAPKVGKPVCNQKYCFKLSISVLLLFLHRKSTESSHLLIHACRPPQQKDPKRAAKTVLLPQGNGASHLSSQRIE
jgi:hypothetical protein